MAKAGFCSRCGGNTWLNEWGGCVAGHGPECVSGVYEVDAPEIPSPIPVPQNVPASRKNPIWVILLVPVLMLCLMMCGIMVAIAIPVFSGAKGNAQRKACFANMRVVRGGAMSYLAEHDGAKLPDDWDGIMTQLAPIIGNAPTCPVGGTYRWVQVPGDDAGGHAECSIHGSAESQERGE